MPFLSLQAATGPMEDSAEELLTLATDDDVAEDATEEELSAKLSGTKTAAAVAATRRERDFFIRKRGKVRP